LRTARRKSETHKHAPIHTHTTYRLFLSLSLVCVQRVHVFAALVCATLRAIRVLPAACVVCVAASWQPAAAAAALLLLRSPCFAFSQLHSCTFRVNPHLDLEPDYIVRKPIVHRIQRCNLHREIFSTFHTSRKSISTMISTPFLHTNQ